MFPIRKFRSSLTTFPHISWWGIPLLSGITYETCIKNSLFQNILKKTSLIYLAWFLSWHGTQHQLLKISHGFLITRPLFYPTVDKPYHYLMILPKRIGLSAVGITYLKAYPQIRGNCTKSIIKHKPPRTVLWASRKLS